MGKDRAPGSVYRKVDLHIHTPQSKDYKDKNATADDIVHAAIAAGLDAIAITDHNDFDFIDRVKQAASGTNLVVFPGVEISTRDGHLIALLDPSQNGSDVKTLLIKCGISTGFGDQETFSNLTMERVAEIIQESGGLAIAAHFDGDGGFIDKVGVGEARKYIFRHKAIDGVELINVNDKSEWVEGLRWDKARACIQGSDAHNLASIGQRPTWIRVASLSIKGLRLALRDPKVRIRFPHEYELIKSSGYIESMRVSQGFFEGLNLRFNPGLNCIIGGQGSGKSAIVEFLRFALGNVSEVKSIKEDNIGKLNGLLGPGGNVSVSLYTSNGVHLLITRIFDNHKNPTRIEQILDDGSRIPYNRETINEEFSILAYSQNEGLSISREIERQLELIDSHLDLSKHWNLIADLKLQLEKNSSELVEIDQHEDDIAELKKQKGELEQKIAELSQQLREIEAVKSEPAIQEQPFWNFELEYLQELTAGIEDLKSRVTAYLSTVKYTQLEKATPPSDLGNDDQLAGLSQIALKTKIVVDNYTAKLSEEFDQILQEMRDSSHAREWNARYKQHKSELQDANERLVNAQANEITHRLGTLRTALSKVETHLTEAEQRNTKKIQLLRTRVGLFEKMDREYAVISQKRRAQAQKMTDILKRRVIISVGTGKNYLSFHTWLMNSRIPRLTVNHVDTIVNSKKTPREFARIVREKDKGMLLAMGLTETMSDNIIASLSKPQTLYSLEELWLDDKPDIRFMRNDREYKLLEHLSTGQKSTVIILLALTDDSMPILYDQPEDAIDTALIYTDIAQILRNTKDHRQFIFATHNSNMSVSADLDLAIVIEGTATSGEVAHADGLEQDEIKNLLVTYLEGGREAIQQRVVKYGIEP